MYQNNEILQVFHILLVQINMITPFITLNKWHCNISIYISTLLALATSAFILQQEFLLNIYSDSDFNFQLAGVLCDFEKNMTILPLKIRDDPFELY